MAPLLLGGQSNWRRNYAYKSCLVLAFNINYSGAASGYTQLPKFVFSARE